MIDLKLPKDTPKPHHTHWLLSNFRSSKDSEFGLGGLLRVTKKTRSGKTIYFIGMAEKGWEDTFKDLETDVHYDDYKECAI